MLRASILCFVIISCTTVAPRAQQTAVVGESPVAGNAAEKTDIVEEVDPKFAAPAEARAAEMREAIAQEIKSLDQHPWAGEYYFGDGLGVNATLNVAPKSGCVFEWYGCMGLYDRNYGTVTEKEGRLHLKLEFPNEQVGFQGVAEELIPVQWGKRCYLIPANDIVGFCNDVNDGSEPREWMHGRYSLRRGDEKLEVEGKPAVPKEYAAYLLDEPIEAEVVAVGQVSTRPSIAEWSFHDTRLTLEPGKNAGLLPGMDMRLVQPDSIYCSLTIMEVDEETCEAVMTTMFGVDTKPEVGWKFSTRLFPIEEVEEKPKPKKRTRSPRKVRQAPASR